MGAGAACVLPTVRAGRGGSTESAEPPRRAVLRKGDLRGAGKQCPRRGRCPHPADVGGEQGPDAPEGCPIPRVETLAEVPVGCDGYRGTRGGERVDTGGAVMPAPGTEKERAVQRLSELKSVSEVDTPRELEEPATCLPLPAALAGG